ncbi:UBN2 domain-containing protein [Cephalotus follicularis]|uniref:UBN2 domain-containing protein n=1 Tax=Cephalotus follicularis TaxID=3775 RepID=A0A1Q3BSQ3_CEPFO|nr:UBN2 domain-containing protein [Cephalotus follicularis]
MKAFLRAYDLWECVEKGYEPSEIAEHMTVAQIKQHKEESSKNFKALSFLHSVVATSIFPRMVGANSAKEAWTTLQEEFQGSERVRVVKLLNLKREFELLKMKETDVVKIML